MGFQMNTDAFSRAMFDMEMRTLDSLEAYAHTDASTMEAYAKDNHPWTDRTGNAATGLKGRVTRSGNVITITLSGSVRYLVYLELAHGKRFAILWPTMSKFKDEIIDGFRRIGENMNA